MVQVLRTSSNPIFQTLLSPAFQDSPAKRDLFLNAAAASAAFSPSSGGPTPPTSSPRCQISCAKSNLVSPRFNRKPGDGRFKLRRALSDSNLEDLASSNSLSSSPSFSSFNPQFHKVSEVPRNSRKMETAPSFSIYGSGFDLEEEKKDENENGEIGLVAGVEEEEDEGVLERSATIGDLIEAIDGQGLDFCFGRTDMGLIMEEAEGEGEDEEEEKDVFDPCPSPPMYLATGLGVDVVPGADLSPNFDDKEVAEEYYRKMVEEFPTHPLLLRNYAELLKSNGDLRGAEDYYFRATLADPEDGEILSQYAKLVWEVHHDKDRAGQYFERAAQTSPHDSHVLAAVASFLWETDNSGTQDFAQNNEDKICNNNDSSKFHEDDVGADFDSHGGGTHLTAGGKDNVPSTEEYYRQLVEQNPSNAMVLRNYAQFLCKSKGDLEGAEAYYSRAILVDPKDGEILSQYANLVWEHYRDEDKARSYFKRSVQAAPEDCHVLAAYASFLWATGEDDEDEENDNEAVLIPSVQTQLAPQIALKGA